MTYHIRNITSEQYYTGNPSKPWVTNVEQSAEYETKREAKSDRRDFILLNHLYNSRKSIHVTKSKD